MVGGREGGRLRARGRESERCRLYIYRDRGDKEKREGGKEREKMDRKKNRDTER